MKDQETDDYLIQFKHSPLRELEGRMVVTDIVNLVLAKCS